MHALPLYPLVLPKRFWMAPRPYLLYRISFLSNSISVARVPFIFYYWMKRKYNYEVTSCGIIGNVLLCCSDIGGNVLWLLDLRIITLSRLIMTIGRFPLFAAVMSFAGLAYLFLGFDAGYRLSTYETPIQRTQAALDLTNSFVQVSLSTFILSGMTCAPLLCVLAGLSLACGATCFCNRCARG